MNPIETARRILQLKRDGKTFKDAAAILGMDIQTVRNTFQLLKCPIEDQEKVADGTMTTKHALERQMDRDNGDSPREIGTDSLTHEQKIEKVVNFLNEMLDEDMFAEEYDDELQLDESILREGYRKWRNTPL